MNKLKTFDQGDGAHCGLTDWYPNKERAILRALRKGSLHPWTTGWYGSKKEIASACITNLAERGNRRIHVEVSVSDDFDTQGMGEVSMPFRGRLKVSHRVEFIRAAIYEAWEMAEQDQRDNRLYRGFSVHGPFTWEGKTRNGWIETYVAPAGIGTEFDSPPGDNYHEWGWQGECEIPLRTREVFEEWVNSSESLDGGASLDHGEYTIKPWRDEE